MNAIKAEQFFKIGFNTKALAVQFIKENKLRKQKSESMNQFLKRVKAKRIDIKQKTKPIRDEILIRKKINAEERREIKNITNNFNKVSNQLKEINKNIEKEQIKIFIAEKEKRHVIEAKEKWQLNEIIKTNEQLKHFQSEYLDRKKISKKRFNEFKKIKNEFKKENDIKKIILDEIMERKDIRNKYWQFVDDMKKYMQQENKIQQNNKKELNNFYNEEDKIRYNIKKEEVKNFNILTERKKFYEKTIKQNLNHKNFRQNISKIQDSFKVIKYDINKCFNNNYDNRDNFIENMGERNFKYFITEEFENIYKNSKYNVFFDEEFVRRSITANGRVSYVFMEENENIVDIYTLLDLTFGDLKLPFNIKYNAKTGEVNTTPNNISIKFKKYLVDLVEFIIKEVDYKKFFYKEGYVEHFDVPIFKNQNNQVNHEVIKLMIGYNMYKNNPKLYIDYPGNGYNMHGSYNVCDKYASGHLCDFNKIFEKNIYHPIIFKRRFERDVIKKQNLLCNDIINNVKKYINY